MISWKVLASAHITFPVAAIVIFNGKDHAFVQTDKQQYEMTEVTVGTKENGFVALTDVEHIISN